MRSGSAVEAARPFGIANPRDGSLFALDPDGNNIEAVYHGQAKRSAPSVQVEFAAPGATF